MTREDLRNEWNELNEQDSFVNKEMTPYAHWLEKKFIEREQPQALDMHGVSDKIYTQKQVEHFKAIAYNQGLSDAGV